MRNRCTGALFILLLGLCFIGVESAFACVGCRTPGEGMGNQERTLQAGLAFSWSVLFMLTVVFSVLSSLIVLVVRACRVADARHTATVQSNYPPRL
jgi:hypothetical protein